MTTVNLKYADCPSMFVKKGELQPEVAAIRNHCQQVAGRVVTTEPQSEQVNPSLYQQFFGADLDAWRENSQERQQLNQETVTLDYYRESEPEEQGPMSRLRNAVQHTRSILIDNRIDIGCRLFWKTCVAALIVLGLFPQTMAITQLRSMAAILGLYTFGAQQIAKLGSDTPFESATKITHETALI